MPARPVTEEQVAEAQRALEQTGGNKDQAAKLLGMSPNGFRNRLAGGSGKGGPVEGIPDGHYVKGVSTLYGPEGEVKGQWVKTNQDATRQAEALSEALEAISARVPRAKPEKAPQAVSDDLMACYVISDAHLGLLAWGEETRGDDWDTAIAEETIVRWMNEAIRSAPKAHTAVLAELGDWLHWDGLEAVTPEHGNILDADTRFQRLVRIAIRVLRRLIALLLKKHQHVHIILADANHDPASSAWLREMFNVLLENEPRATVDTSPDPYYSVLWGETSLYFHHGHKAKIDNVSKVFAGKFSDTFGKTKYRYAHVGHRHCVESREDPLMIVEQHPTLAAMDAYASRSGYLSQRGASVITYHKQWGEVGRSTIRPEMLR